MGVVNHMQLFFPALPVNEAFARLAISGFILPLNPTMEELADIKTAVSEAVTNAVVHGYGDGAGVVRLEASYTEEEVLRVDVRDNGRGIEDIEQARQPFFTIIADVIDEIIFIFFTKWRLRVNEHDCIKLPILWNRC